MHFKTIRRNSNWMYGTVLALLFSSSGAVLASSGQHAAKTPDNIRAATQHAASHANGYACPMHPQVTQKEPGRCLMCDMDLVSAAEASKPSALAATENPADDPHAHHRQMMNQQGYQRSEHSYGVADLALVDMSGEEIGLLAELNGGEPVMLNFIFTTCTTICPILSATFLQVQQELGDAVDGVRMVSITIDPEHDTPERLRAYAERFNAGSQWQFLTGELEQIVAVQKAFDAYRGSKMNHEPVTFLRATDGEPWVRLDGLASASDVVREYRQLIASRD